ncbi:hypothetical protein [Mediterranea massiliensis]|uniref:hypothetical protein n=1 Tax=Mediterranea massiliensis TaxID=1841865 RepID=UPI0023F08603|nr:hypothetical protein [Mediterranea massiliensis]
MKKILFSTMLLAGMLASCSDEEFGTVNSVDTTDRRTQIDLILNGNAASTRLTPTDESFTYTTKDVLGAVLVDNGVINKANSEKGEEQNYVVDWTISDSHVGNNKWYWDGSKFATEGTTSVGAWLFYTRYNKDMSVNRNGVEYTFPQIQEYASDYEWIANNNVNFIVSPIYRIDGYEGESIQLPVYQGSIHSTVKLNLELPNAVTEVQKIVLTAKDAKGNSVQFPTKGRILNTKMDAAGAVANMLISGGSSFDSQYKLHHIYGNTTAEDMKAASLKAFYNFMNSDGKDAEGNAVYMDQKYRVNLAEDDDNDLQAKYTEITQPVGNNTVPFLVLDCVENHNDEAAPGVAVTGGKFTSYMLIPAGIYQSITLYVYTNDGIYKKEVNKRDMTVEEDESASTANTDKKLILLRRHTRVNLANITQKASQVEDAAIKIVEDDSKDAETVAEELDGVVVTKTADLIAAINGSQDAKINFWVVNQAEQNFGSDAAVPEHTTLINKAVADATEAMINRFKGETVNLIFQNSEMKIKGEETPYDLKNMTFNQGCNLTAGSINVAERIHFEGMTFKVQKGATANFTEGNVENNIPEEYLNESALENYGTVNFKKNTKITTITNKDGGVVNVEQILSVIENMKNYESVVVTATGNMTVNDLTNVGREDNVPYNATVVNNNFLTFTGENSKNAGIITNNMKEKKVEVKGTLTNMEGGVINNVEDALFIAQTTGKIYNEMKGNINNAGELYCIIEGSDRGQIENYGTITAEEGALTYITTNQKDKIQTELLEDNIDNTNIGRIILKERGSNMSVSTANMQGIIEYTLPENTSKWVPQEGDKFNKLILANTANNKVNNPIDLTALKSVTSEGITKVISVEISGDNYVKFADNQALKELIIDGNVNILGQKVSTAILRVMNGKLTIPTNNVFGVYSFKDDTGNTVTNGDNGLYIKNHATILVGGRFYTILKEEITEDEGEFASGAGSEAYIFESPETNFVPSWTSKTTTVEP